MKKAKPQKTASDDKAGDSEKVTLKKLDHAAGIVKAALTTGGKLADWGKQATASKASIEGSRARVRAADRLRAVWPGEIALLADPIPQGETL